MDVDGSLLYHGFRSSGLGPVPLDGPPPRNIKTIFGDTSGVLGALTKDGSVYLLKDDIDNSKSLEFKKHHFSEDNFIYRQSLVIDHLALADNGEVCICTSAFACSSLMPPL